MTTVPVGPSVPLEVAPVDFRKGRERSLTATSLSFSGDNRESGLRR
jgi:hypothetical protein